MEKTIRLDVLGVILTGDVAVPHLILGAIDKNGLFCELVRVPYDGNKILELQCQDKLHLERRTEQNVQPYVFKNPLPGFIMDKPHNVKTSCSFELPVAYDAVTNEFQYNGGTIVVMDSVGQDLDTVMLACQPQLAFIEPDPQSPSTSDVADHLDAAKTGSTATNESPAKKLCVLEKRVRAQCGIELREAVKDASTKAEYRAKIDGIIALWSA